MEALSLNTSIFCTYNNKCASVRLNPRGFYYKHAEGLLVKQPRNCLKMNVSYPDTDLILSETNSKASRVSQLDNGIGITKTLAGKTLFVTGATGLLGKAFVEKILRAIPDVRKMFIMVKGTSKEAAMDRLRKEIMESELFTCLQQVHGESYTNFILSKIVPVLGNVGETNLGLEEDMADLMKKEVQIILNCAANTSFNERYDMMLDLNTYGPSRLMSFAKQCHNILLFVQVSTAFVSGKREGILMEKAVDGADSTVGNILDVEDETKLLVKAKQGLEGDEFMSQKMKQLGLERASKLGWQNAYMLTKAMGEMILNTLKGDLPVVIIRPACIKSTYREPFPGWIEGIRLLDPVILFYGKGQLTGFVAKPDNDPDIVPLDMVVNATIAAMAMHAASGNPNNLIYHVASSVANTIAYRDLVDLFYDHFKCSPIINSNGEPIQISRMKLLSSMEEFHSHYSEEDARIPSTTDQTSTAMRKLKEKTFEQIKFLNNMYKKSTLCDARFDCTNTKAMIECMSKEEKQQFGFDVTDVDWREYIVNIHIPGLRRHVMKGRLG